MKTKIVPYVIVVANALASAAPALAVPVVPNFQQGSMTSHTETESTVQETIFSIDYRTGWEYSVTGVGVSNNGEALNPNVNTSTVTVTPSQSATSVNGVNVSGTVTSSFDSLDFSQTNNFTITTPGEAFQFTQSYQGPGMTNQTIIQRTTTIKSVTDTTSTFTQ
tara:strand:- start:101 stop:592 length:492 start_codon:yes stop_codon:yes gene_type:complete